MRSTGKARRGQGDIEVVGARANNLKDLDVCLPLGKVSLVAGVSGSGKSSLLEDTLATEANSRMKRFLGVSQDHLEDLEVDAFVGPVPPAVHFSQGGFRSSVRTTVATCSGLLATIRELLLRHGRPWSEEMDAPVPPPSSESYREWLRHHYRGPLAVWAVAMRNVRGDGRKAVAALGDVGIESIVVRSETDPPEVWERGREVDVSSFKPLDRGVRHVIEAKLVDTTTGDVDSMLAALRKAFAVGGDVVVELNAPGTGLEELRGPHGCLLDSHRHWVHPAVRRPYAPPSRPLFSFNQPGSDHSGACPECRGLGEALDVSLEALVAHPERSMHDGAIALWSKKGYKHVNIQHEAIEGLRGLKGFDPDAPWRQLSESARRLVLFGGVAVADRDRSTGRKLGEPRPYPGFVPQILGRVRKGTRSAARLAPFVRQGRCPSCGGTRWSREARAVRVGPFNAPSLLGISFSELLRESSPKGGLRQKLPRPARPFVDQLHRLSAAFSSVGLGHLSGERGMLTLSEGESRRLRLAALLHARGAGLALLLDEPGRGLHDADIGRLVEALKQLRTRHTVILNDHRYALAPAVDHVIELGPKAGEEGGRLVRQGPPDRMLPESEEMPSRKARIVFEDHPTLEVKGARLHNLDGVTCRFPLGRLVAITGVSGSGKSSFLRGILMPALAAQIGDEVSLEGFSTLAGGRWDSLTGAEEIRQVVGVEQRRPEPNRRSLVATFLGIAGDLRRAYASLPLARELGLRASDFGLNDGEGRCGTCLGLGEVESAGDGLDVCSACGGRRFGDRVLAVQADGWNMAELLNRSISDLVEHPPTWAGRLEDLFRLVVDLDVGYLSLGRRIDRTSGGEVQRLRIARHLWTAKAQGTLLVLDEPSAGLHPRDVAQLLGLLDRIVGEGENSVLVVEHNLQIVRASDWILDFGPGGGPDGGEIVAQGPPSHVMRKDTSTGRALRNAPTQKSVSRGEGTSAPDEPADSPTPDGAARALRWLRVLLGHDSALPAEDEDRADLDQLAVVRDRFDASGRWPCEVGGLDRELAQLALWAGERPTVEEQCRALVEVWRKRSDARLWIAPAVPLIQEWGLRIPTSDIDDAQDRLLRLELREQTDDDDPSAWRATGDPLQCDAQPGGDRSSALRYALNLGGGLVELRANDGVVLARVRARKLDLQAGLVAPVRLTTSHLTRRGIGSCRACGGAGSVLRSDLDLLVADRRKPPLAEEFLRPEAQAVFRGVRRNVMVPFFRRLEKEGLWRPNKPFGGLSDEERELFLSGYWCRPGPGSFLKSSKHDAKKVSSWLAWDGLFFHVFEQLPRSKDTEWSEAVQGSKRMEDCRLCDGSGLATASRLVDFEGRSLRDWVAHGTFGELNRALQHHQGRTERERRLRKTVMDGYKLIAEADREAPLKGPLTDSELFRETLRAVVQCRMEVEVI